METIRIKSGMHMIYCVASKEIFFKNMSQGDCVVIF